MQISYIELKHHHALCMVLPKGDGTHAASVTFERKADHGKTSLPARKFNLPGRYADAATALKAAVDFATMMDEARSVGL